MKETIKTSINFRANFSLRNITNKHEYHFMLQFNIDVHIGTRFSLEFQYILCYGSTGSGKVMTQIKNYFNTSYVMVQRTEVCNVRMISWDFNTSYVTVQQAKPQQYKHEYLGFQYILCYGSTIIFSGNILVT